MRTAFIPTAFSALAVAVLACSAPPRAQADEFEQQHAFYEDDAWYDVSEWLDGNDYNPTDEVVGRWDDETYGAAPQSGDEDNDAPASQDQNIADGSSRPETDATQRQSYYSDPNEQNIYTYRWDYFDYDLDGYYDAMTSFHDSDNDGSYEHVDYYYFTDLKKGSQSKSADAKDQKADQRQSKSVAVTGTVKSVKKAEVRGGEQRWVAQVATNDGQQRMVDFGPASELKGKLSEGQKVTAHGPLLKAGENHIVLAQRVSLGDEQEQQINRSGRQLSGKIAKLHHAKIRGEQHQMALLNLDSGKQALIDLGNAESLGVKLQENEQIEVRGVPVKVKDRLVVIANSITHSGEKTEIERVASKASAPKSS
jgi:hypothetical protein